MSCSQIPGSFPSILNAMAELLPIINSVDGSDIDALNPRIDALLAGIDFALPGAQETLRGRVKELLPSLVSFVRKITTCPQFGSFIEKMALSVQNIAPQILGLVQTSFTQAPLQPPTTLVELLMYITNRQSQALIKIMGEHDMLLPSTIEEIEPQLQMCQKVMEFNRQCLIAAEAGIQEKEFADEERHTIENVRHNYEKLQSILPLFEQFVADEKARISPSESSSSQTFDSFALMAWVEAKQALEKPFNDLTSELVEKILSAQLAAQGSTEVLIANPNGFLVSQLALELEPKLVEAERSLVRPEALDKIRFTQTMGHKFMSSFFVNQGRPLGDIPREILDREPIEKLMPFVFAGVFLSLAPEIFMQIRPLVFRLCREHPLILKPLASLDVAAEIGRASVNSAPQSELAKRYKEVVVKMTEAMSSTLATKRKFF